MPRRIPGLRGAVTDWNMVSSIGGFGFGLSQLLFPYIIWKCVRVVRASATRPGRARTDWSGAALAPAVPLVDHGAFGCGHRPRGCALMAQQMLSAVGAGPAEAERRRRVRRTAIAFTLIAAGFYFGFIIMMLVRGSK